MHELRRRGTHLYLKGETNNGSLADVAAYIHGVFLKECFESDLEDDDDDEYEFQE